MLNKFKKIEEKKEKFTKGHSRTKKKYIISEEEEHIIDKAEDRVGKLEDRLIEHNQIEARGKN